MNSIDIIDELSSDTLLQLRNILDVIEDGSDLVINISSYGGEILPTIGMIDLLRSKHLNVTCNIIGYACSAAAILALSCQTVNISPLGSLMIHSAWADDADSEDAGIARCNEVQLAIIKERCKGYTEDLLKYDHWYDAKQCLELGLCDNIYNNSNNIKALATKYAAKFKSLNKENVDMNDNETLNVEEVIEEVKQDEEATEENHDVVELIEKLVERVDELENRLKALEEPAEEDVKEDLAEADCPDEQDRINNIYKMLVKPQACAPIACGKTEATVCKVPKGFEKYARI